MNIVYFTFYHLAKFIARAGFSFKAINPDRMIERGPLILAANHASFYDPPLAGICSRRDIYFLARKNILKWPILGPLFPYMNVIPVERDGNDMSALREVIKKIRAGNGVLLFPEGTRSLDGQLQAARAGVGFVVAKTWAPVIPMRIFGAYEAFPKGARMPRRRQISVVLGQPIVFDPIKIGNITRSTYHDISDTIMDGIASLSL